MAVFVGRAYSRQFTPLLKRKHAAFPLFIANPYTTAAINAQVIIPVEEGIIFFNRGNPCTRPGKVSSLISRYRQFSEVRNLYPWGTTGNLL